MDTSQYLTMFIDESKENLQVMNEQLLALETDANNKSIIQQLFRAAHTLKGMSATMGYMDIADLTHHMENVLDLIRNDQLSMNDQIFDILFMSCDRLEAMVSDIANGGSGSGDVSAIVKLLSTMVLNETQSGTAQPSNALDDYHVSVLKQSIESGYRVLFITVQLREDSQLKAARAYMVFEVLERNGEIIHTIPTVNEIENDQFGYQFSVYFITTTEPASVKEFIMNISEMESVQLTELGIETIQHHVQQEKTSMIESDQLSPASELPTEAQSKSPAVHRTIRVDIERLDMLMNLFSELLIDRTRLESISMTLHNENLNETVEHLSRVSSDIQNIVLKLRMIPIEAVFNRFPRMIRDIAKNLDKKVDLVIDGADTELDRKVIDEIGDPLVHLLRNAVDHGIESVQERIAAGKPETGTIHLCAYHSGNHVIIEIEEDGRGIDRNKVLNIAIQRGIVTVEQSESWDDQQVYKLLFASGFSTADHISDISGRGVGLDVVNSKIKQLGGKVHIDSKPGIGTKFTIQFPLTLSFIVAMLIRLNKENYAIPLSAIVETMCIDKAKLHQVQAQQMVHYRGEFIPVVSLKQIFDVPGDEGHGQSYYNLVVVRKADRLIAFVVDDFVGQQEIVIKSLGAYLSHVFGISGATILGDGEVALIIDPSVLVK